MLAKCFELLFLFTFSCRFSVACCYSCSKATRYCDISHFISEPMHCCHKNINTLNPRSVSKRIIGIFLELCYFLSVPLGGSDHKEQLDDTSATKKCSRNFMIFTVVKNFPRGYFPDSKPGHQENPLCVITGLPAKYKDPLTSLPFAT